MCKYKKKTKTLNSVFLMWDNTCVSVGALVFSVPWKQFLLLSVFLATFLHLTMFSHFAAFFLNCFPNLLVFCLFACVFLNCSVLSS